MKDSSVNGHMLFSYFAQMLFEESVVCEYTKEVKQSCRSLGFHVLLFYSYYGGT